MVVPAGKRENVVDPSSEVDDCDADIPCRFIGIGRAWTRRKFRDRRRRLVCDGRPRRRRSAPGRRCGDPGRAAVTAAGPTTSFRRRTVASSAAGAWRRYHRQLRLQFGGPLSDVARLLSATRTHRHRQTERQRRYRRQAGHSRHLHQRCTSTHTRTHTHTHVTVSNARFAELRKLRPPFPSLPGA